MAKKKGRPCPRGLYDGCPIPRELCSGDYERTGTWHCMEFLKEFEQFVFGADEQVEEPEMAEGMEEVVTLDDLMRVLEGLDGDKK